MDDKRGAELIPLTVPEVRKLLLRLVWHRLTPVERALAWAEWRHQHRARASHYKKRKAKAPLTNDGCRTNMVAWMLQTVLDARHVTLPLPNCKGAWLHAHGRARSTPRHQ